MNNEKWLSVVDGFSNAGINGEGWTEALAGLAELTGARTGQLVGFGSNAAIPFNFMSNFDAEAMAEFAAIGGANPDYNPRVRAGLTGALMKSMTEADFATREEFEAGAYYTDFCRRHDIPWGCIMPMMRDSNSMIGLAVFRGRRQGPVTDREQAAFDSIAPHVRSAVRVQSALENQGALILQGALEALSLAVFVADRFGTIRAMTSAAEELVRDGGALRMRQGQLRATSANENQRFAELLLAATERHADPRLAVTPTCLVLGGEGGRPLLLDIVPLPARPHALGFEPRALIVVRGGKPDNMRTLALLQAAYRLTPAEAQVALQLAEGLSPQQIATQRVVSVSTVRVQIRTLFVKLGVRRQSELVARLNHLG